MDLKHYAQKVAEMRRWQDAERTARLRGRRKEALTALETLVKLEKEIDDMTKRIAHSFSAGNF